jgi:hypothetical protein
MILGTPVVPSRRAAMMEESRREEFARLRDSYAQQLREEHDALVVDVAEGEVDLRSMESERANEVEE